jgi:heavy metal efflux system protein
MAGRVVTSYYDGERPVPIRVRIPPAERAGASLIAQIPVPSPGGGRIPLGELAEISTGPGRSMISREANSRYLALKFNVDGRDLGSVISEAMAVVDEQVTLPPDHYFVWGGEFENQQRAMERLKVIVPIALLIVLALLYSSLGSARSAITILLMAPFAITGGIFALKLAGVVLSVSAAVGFIALLGQVALAGLLVLTAIENRRRAGEGLSAAIVTGASERLRAVIMLALLASLGLLPMGVSTAVGSEVQRPFAVVIIGGMVTTLLVTVIVLPVLYSLLTPRVLRAGEEEDE